jgi:hypothetical protein
LEGGRLFPGLADVGLSYPGRLRFRQRFGSQAGERSLMRNGGGSPSRAARQLRRRNASILSLHAQDRYWVRPHLHEVSCFNVKRLKGGQLVSTEKPRASSARHLINEWEGLNNPTQFSCHLRSDHRWRCLASMGSSRMPKTLHAPDKIKGTCWIGRAASAYGHGFAYQTGWVWPGTVSQ